MAFSFLMQAAGTAAITRHRHTAGGNTTVRYFFKLGLLGLFFIAVIDSSPIPLPIPGSSDLLVTLLAAQRHAWLMVTLVATAGSAVGAMVSYHTGVAGGVALVDRYVPARFRDRIQHWTEEHALLSVALPAILPPPAPLMPFLIAAGAFRMPKTRYYVSFTASRFVRHALFAWLGVHYGRRIMPVYLRFADRYGWILLVIVWGSVGFGAVYALLKLRARKSGRRASATAAA